MSAAQKTLAFLILSAVMIALLAFMEPSLDDDVVTSDEFWLTKCFQTDRYDVVAIGDSRVYRGIAPQVITASTGLSAFNLGFSSGGLSSAVFRRAEEVLDTTDFPVIVVGLTPHSLSVKGIENQQFKEWREKYDARQASQQLRWNRFYRFFEPFRVDEWIMKRNTSAHYFETSTYYRNGWAASQSAVDDARSALGAYRKIATDNPIQPSAIDSLVYRVDEWTKRGITVIAFRVPSTEAMETLEDSLFRFDVDGIRDRLKDANAIWLDFPRNGFRSYDGSHLHYSAAMELSGEIAAVIGERAKLRIENNRRQ